MDKRLKTLVDASDDILELARHRNSLLKLIEDTPEIPLITARSEGSVITTSFRVYEDVIHDFRLFAQCFPGIKNQDLFSQALSDFIDRHKEKWRMPILIEVGSDLLPLVDKTKKGKMLGYIQSLRASYETSDGKSFPPINIRGNARLGVRDYRISVNGKERSGGKVTKSTKLFEQDLFTVIQEQSGTY